MGKYLIKYFICFEENKIQLKISKHVLAQRSQNLLFNPQICFRFAEMMYKCIYSISISIKNAYENIVCANGLVRIQKYINTQFNDKFNQNSDHPDGHDSFL
jgi:hypothetical protein